MIRRAAARVSPFRSDVSGIQKVPVFQHGFILCSLQRKESAGRREWRAARGHRLVGDNVPPMPRRSRPMQRHNAQESRDRATCAAVRAGVCVCAGNRGKSWVGKHKSRDLCFVIREKTVGLAWFASEEMSGKAVIRKNLTGRVAGAGGSSLLLPVLSRTSTRRVVRNAGYPRC